MNTTLTHTEFRRELLTKDTEMRIFSFKVMCTAQTWDHIRKRGTGI